MTLEAAVGRGKAWAEDGQVHDLTRNLADQGVDRGGRIFPGSLMHQRAIAIGCLGVQ